MNHKFLWAGMLIVVACAGWHPSWAEETPATEAAPCADEPTMAGVRLYPYYGAYQPGMNPYGPYYPAWPMPPASTALSCESLPHDARDLLKDYEADKAAIQKEAEKQIRERRQALIEELKPLQDKYTREALLDEAVAIRDLIRRLKEPIGPVLPDPGALYQFMGHVGRTFHFRVVGRVEGGSLWGSDVYTIDSTLSAAAVHAGVLKPGQTGVVKVTILPGRPAYQGSTRHGVTSSSYGSFAGSYKVERADDGEQAPKEEK